MKLKLSLPARANYTVMLASAVYLAVSMLMSGIDTQGDILRGSAFSALFVSLGALLLPAFLFMRMQNEPFAVLRFGLKRVSFTLILLAVPVGVALYMLSGGLSSIIETLAKGAGLGAGYAVQYDVSSWRIAGTLIVSALVPAIAEETLFHGVLLFAWTDVQRGGNVKKRAVGAVLLSTLVYTLFHLDIVNFVPIAVSCLVMGVSAYWAKSAVPGMVIHFTVSALGIILYATRASSGLSEYAALGFRSDSEGALIFIAAGAALLAAALIAFKVGVNKGAERERRAKQLLSKVLLDMQDGDMAPVIQHFVEALKNMEKAEEEAFKARAEEKQEAAPLPERLAGAFPLIFTLALLISLNILVFTARLPI